MNFHPSMAGIESVKRRRNRKPRLEPMTEQEIQTARQMREDGAPWIEIVRALGKTEYQIQKTLGHVTSPMKKRIRGTTLDANTPDDGFNTVQIAKSCDDLLDALHRYHVAPYTDSHTERPRIMRITRADYSYCGSPAQMCIEGRASSGGKTKTHEGAR